MARGVTLGELLVKLKIAARYDPNPALSLNMVPLFIQSLQDTQERLYDDFDWPFLKISPDKVLATGQRYYDVPANMNLERIQAVDLYYGGKWLPVERGISLDNYNSMDPEVGVQADPVVRWDVVDTGTGAQVEVWPVPASNGAKLRFTGIRKLKPLIANADLADLDDQIIVLYAAGELLGGAKNPEAQVKFEQAKRRLATLHGRVTHRRAGSFVLGGEVAVPTDRTPLVAYVRAP